MLSAQEIKYNLGNFYGSQGYYEFSPLFSRIYLSDGTKYIAESCEAYWLMDLIANHIPSIGDDWFAVAKLTVKGSECKFVIEDGNGNVIASQDIDFTDFPLDEITLFVERGDDNWVILLPGEH